MVELENKEISITKQCLLLEVNRTGIYYKARPLYSLEDIEIMGHIDREYTEHPIFRSTKDESIFRINWLQC